MIKKTYENVSLTNIKWVAIRMVDEDTYSIFIESSKIFYCYLYEKGKWFNRDVKINDILVDTVVLTDKTNILITQKIKEKNLDKCFYPTNYSVEKLMLLYEIVIKYLNRDLFLPLFLMTD